MKICYVFARFKGGLKVYAMNVMENLDHDFTIYTGTQADKADLKSMEKKGIKVKTTKLLDYRNPLTLFLAFLQMIFYFRKFDLIHTGPGRAGWIAKPAGKLAGCKVLHTNHAVIFENRRFSWFFSFMEKISSWFCDGITDISKTVKEKYEAKGIGVGKHFMITPCGIDFNKFKNAKPANLKGKFKVVTIALLSKRKGVDKFIDIADGLDDISFYVVGDGPDRKNLEDMNKKIHFLGFRKDIEKILKACDSLVLMSDREGTPLVIYEAMAAGLPCIALDVGGIRDQIDETTGFLVKNSIEARMKLLELYNDRELIKSMGSAAQKKASNFTVKKMVSKVDEAYRYI